MQLTQTNDLGDNTMAQAKTLTTAEIERLLTHINTRKYSARNRSMMLLTHWAGLRIGEVACLRWSDVTTTDGEIKDEIRLLPDMTKGRHARTVFVNAKLKRELEAYVRNHKPTNPNSPLFYTQKREGFTPNTLAQHFHYLYKRAGIAGGSSHSGRRTFITNLAAKGVGVRVLMSLAGHRSISTTQAYIDVNDDMKRRAVELV